MDTSQFHALDSEIKSRGLPPLFEVPCPQFWSEHPNTDPFCIRLERDDNGDTQVSFTDDAWDELSTVRWTETKATREVIPTDLEFELEHSDDRMSASTSYVAHLKSLSERRVVLGSGNVVYICSATYEFEVAS